MTIEGFTPYAEEVTRLYEKKRWWLGLTIGDVLDKSSDLYPSKEAVVGNGRRYTYSEIRFHADSLAFRLIAEGLRPGDRVLIQLPNSPEFVIAYFGLQKAGLIPVLLTVNHTTREISHLANLTKPKGWILPGHYRKTDFLGLIEEVKRDNTFLGKLVLVEDQVSNQYLRFGDLIQKNADDNIIRSTLEQARPDPLNVCQLLPSGGTTGLPKVASRTHNDYLCNVEYKSKAWDINVNDICLVATTVGHNLALLVSVIASIFHGAKMVMLDSTYPQDFCSIVQDERVTCTGLVPTLISRIVNYEHLGDYDLSSLKKIYVGAANSPPDLVQSVEKKLKCRYFNAFGMVEGPCAQTRYDDPLEVRCHTIGRPVCPYDRFAILRPDGSFAPTGEEGELVAKGPGIFSGYYMNPQANRDSFTPEGYFRTGDLAIIDENGIIRITGRIKDIIIRGGENIAARDVEDLISSYPEVEYVAVIGMPDFELGEQVCAYIKPVKGTSLTEKEILVHLENLGASRILYPKRIIFVQALPLTAAGKADKKVLRRDIEERMKSEAKN
jgi:non-ribosomal peptide synthetase component E (peptide arylation enzyme)